MNKINKQNRNRHRDTENPLTTVREMEAWAAGWKNVKGVRKKTHKHSEQYGDYQTERERGW